MKTVVCDLCGSDQYDVLFSQKEILHKVTAGSVNLCRCKKCQLCFVNPRPGMDEIAGFYPEDTYPFWVKKNKWRCRMRSILRTLVQEAFLTGSHGWMRLMARMFLWPLLLVSKGRRLIVKNIVPKVDSFLLKDNPRSILDIGCGVGEDLHFFDDGDALVDLKQSGWIVEGIEPSAKARQIAKDCYGFDFKEDLFKAAFGDDTFDVVRMNWSLEHVPEPLTYLKECKRILKKGGRLIISVPNYDGITYKIFPTCVEVPVHLHYFTVSTMKQYAQKLGLDIVGYSTYSYPMHFGFILKLVGKDDLSEDILGNVTKSVQLQSYFDVMAKLDLGDDMTFCLTKS